MGSAKIWQQVADEGRAAYPTQSRVMYKGDSAPACSRFGMTQSFVPFQPNTSPDGTANPKAGLDDAILFGATKADPGGLPKGTLEYLTFSRFLNVAGEPFKATLHLKGSLKPGKVTLTVPPGWTTSAPQNVGKVSDKEETKVTFTVTPIATAAVNQNFRSPRSTRAARRPATPTTSYGSCRRPRAASSDEGTGKITTSR